MKNKITILSLLLILSFTSCEDDFLEVSDANNLISSAVFTDAQTANLALNGVYSPLKDVDLWGDQIHFLLHQITDEYDLIWQGDAGWNQIKRLSVTPENSTIKAAWYGVSKMVLRANEVITNVNLMTVPAQITLEQKNSILGQAHFLRAYAMFLAVRIWGQKPYNVDPTALGVPVITSVPKTRDEMYVSRSTVQEVYDQVIEDLKAAELLLPTSWPANEVGKVTTSTASAYLGQVYLYQENWSEAIAHLQKVIDNPRYRLLPAFSDNFNGRGENGSESLFEVQYTDKSAVISWDGGAGHPYATRHAPAPLGWGNVSVSQKTIDFFNGDPRLNATAFIPSVDSVKVTDQWQKYQNTNGTGYAPKKFIRNDRSAINTGSSLFNNEINMPLMRLADVYLMYAEAQNEIGNSTAALEFLNKVRRRAYGFNIESPSSADISGSDAATIRQAIRDERYIELLGEGHRWFDLLRWGIADEVLAGKGFEPGIDEAMPFPIDEVELNKEMEQNFGY